MESAKFCRELILAHSARRPPFSIEVFTPEQASLADSFMMDNYMRHFKLYKYVFTPRIVMDLAFQYPNEPEREVIDNNGKHFYVLSLVLKMSTFNKNAFLSKSLKISIPTRLKLIHV